MHSLWVLLSQLGDSRWLLPLSGVLNLFGARANRALRMRWAFGLVVVGGLSLASKLAFLGWGIGWARLDFTGFSGHATMTAAVYPVVFYLMLQGRVRWPLAGAVLGALLAAAIAYSRLPLNAHSVSEVVSGSLLGIAVSAMALRARDDTARTPLPAIAAAVLGAAMTLVLLSGVRTHDLVMRLATDLSGRGEVFTRASACSHPASHAAPACQPKR